MGDKNIDGHRSALFLKFKSDFIRFFMTVGRDVGRIPAIVVGIALASKGQLLKKCA